MKLLALLIFFYSPIAYSYPELTRHGYVNCTTCHVSPSGGGILTPYGRELSKELVSTWSKEGEQNFAYGAFDTGDKLLVSAYLRGLQVLTDTQSAREARAILMQADAEVAYNRERWAVVGTAGRQELRSGLLSQGQFTSRRHYLLVRPTDQWNIRAGKFMRNFGLNEPNHNIFVRRELGFGFDTESYNAEVAYLGDNLSLYGTYIKGKNGDKTTYFDEHGASLTASYYFWDAQKVGVSLYDAKNDLQERKIAGPWSILSYQKKLFLLSELDFQQLSSRTSASVKQGYVTTQELKYEIYKGILPFLSFDRKRLDYNDPSSRQYAYGLGVQSFPRPHFELMASWQKQVDQTTSTSSDLYWVMLFFYL